MPLYYTQDHEWIDVDGDTDGSGGPVNIDPFVVLGVIERHEKAPQR